MDTVEVLLVSGSLEERKTLFQLWVNTVRDPAEENSEGVREIFVINGAAVASYEVAELPDRRWAVTVQCSYECGDCFGVRIPWTDFPSREECVDFFCSTAQRHFQKPIQVAGSALQVKAQLKMNQLLMHGLFGFMEPLPLLNLS